MSTLITIALYGCAAASLWWVFAPHLVARAREIWARGPHP